MKPGRARVWETPLPAWPGKGMGDPSPSCVCLTFMNCNDPCFKPAGMPHFNAWELPSRATQCVL